MQSQVGVIGVGNIGFGIASNLIEAGFKVFAYDVRLEPLEALREKGGVIVADIREMAKACPTVFSVLLDYQQNLEVLTGAEGLLENTDRGSCVFICSTLSPEQVKGFADLAESRGIRLLDSPVSGGAQGAIAGTLTIMIGGPQEAVEENRKALEAIGSNIYHLGEVGSGASAKTINQLLLAIHNVAAAEALLLAAKSGIKLELIYDIIKNCAGYSWMFEHRAMRMIQRDFEPRGVLRILLKDTNIVMEAAQSLDLVLPVTGIVRQLYQAGVNCGLGDEDDSAIVKVLEKLTHYELPETRG
jgi:3-hydroxyisobutyrate dehydrogenase